MKPGRFFVVVLATVCLWQLAAAQLRSPLLPAPALVAQSLVRELPGELGRHTLISAWRVIVSSAVAGSLAGLIGLLIGQLPGLDAWTAPLIRLTYPIPKIVFLPLVLLTLGLGDASKVFMISLIIFYQVLIVVRDAAVGVRLDIIDSARSMGAGRWQMLRYVYLPACLPAILTSLRISTGTAIAVLFFTESFATEAGLGYYVIVRTWGRMDYPPMYAGIIMMALLGVLLYAVLDQLENRLCPWTKAEWASR